MKRKQQTDIQRLFARLSRLERKVKDNDRLAARGMKMLASRILDLEADIFEEGPGDEDTSQDAH